MEEIYHFTTLEGAFQLVRGNKFYLSPSTFTEFDRESSQGRFYYLSLTTEPDFEVGYPGSKNIRKDNTTNKLPSFFEKMTAMVVLDMDKLRSYALEHGMELVDVDYYGQLTVEKIAKMSKAMKNQLKERGIDGTGSPEDKAAKEEACEYEVRLISDHNTIPNALQFITEVELDDLHFDTMRDDTKVKVLPIIVKLQEILGEKLNLGNQRVPDRRRFNSFRDYLDLYKFKVSKNKTMYGTEYDLDDRSKLNESESEMLVKVIASLLYHDPNVRKDPGSRVKKTLEYNFRGLDLETYGLNIDQLSGDVVKKMEEYETDPTEIENLGKYYRTLVLKLTGGKRPLANDLTDMAVYYIEYVRHDKNKKTDKDINTINKLGTYKRDLKEELVRYGTGYSKIVQQYATGIRDKFEI